MGLAAVLIANDRSLNVSDIMCLSHGRVGRPQT